MGILQNLIFKENIFIINLIKLFSCWKRKKSWLKQMVMGKWSNLILQHYLLLPSLWLWLPASPFMLLPHRCYLCQFFGHIGQNCWQKALSVNAVGWHRIPNAQLIPLNVQIVRVPTLPHQRGVIDIYSREVISLKTIEKLTFSEACDCMLTCCICPGITVSPLTKSTS